MAERKRCRPTNYLSEWDIDMTNAIQLPELNSKARLSATYQLQARRADGSVSRKSAVFKNLITDFGLDHLAISGCRSLYCGKCYVGTGTAVPSFSDTALAVPLANTASFSGTQTSSESVSPWRQTTVTTATFPTGAVVGNLTEVGFGDTAGLFSRALVVDGGGAPTAFPIAADEQLIVVYSLVQYPPLVDATGTISIGSNSYDYVSRANFLVGYNPNPWAFPSSSTDGVAYRANSAYGLNDAHGDLAPLPGGVNVNPDFGFSKAADAYVPGSHYVSGTFTCPPASGNGLLRLMVVNFGSASCQIRYTPAITKTSTQTLVLPFSFTWARA